MRQIIAISRRLLRHDGGSVGRDADWIAKIGGGMLFSVIFFGLLCIAGFASCQIIKHIKCCPKKSTNKQQHDPIRQTLRSDAATIEMNQHLNELDDEKPQSYSPVGVPRASDVTPSPSKKAKANAVAPISLEDAFDKEIASDE